MHFLRSYTATMLSFKYRLRTSCAYKTYGQSNSHGDSYIPLIIININKVYLLHLSCIWKSSLMVRQVISEHMSGYLWLYGLTITPTKWLPPLENQSYNNHTTFILIVMREHWYDITVTRSLAHVEAMYTNQIFFHILHDLHLIVHQTSLLPLST